MIPPTFASIPSPSVNIIHLGGIPIHLYGLCIALGVIAAVVISSKRWEARGGNPDDISTIALWSVPAGVIGARMYHVATDWKTYEGRWVDALKITQGGLGIPGGIAAGVLVGWIVVRIKGWPARDLLDVVAPAIPVAQAIGRFGNWFNQEVFGRPTSLPWGLEIAPEHRPARYLNEPTFHPTFLYEGLWNLALAGLLVVLERRGKLRKGELFVLYIFGYAIGRLWVESLRSDPASLVFGVRINIWMSLLTGIVSLAYLAWNRRPGSSVQVAGSPIAADHLDASVALDANAAETALDDDAALPDASGRPNDADPTAAQEAEVGIGDRDDANGSD